MKIKLRNIKLVLGFFGFALLSESCQDWLDVSPKSEVKYDDLFSYKNGFKDQLTGVYTALCGEGLYGAHLSFGMLDALGQQYVWKQEVGNYYHLHRFEYKQSSSQGVINGVWSNMYNAIANINILLKGIEEHRGVLSEDEERIYEGEAYALRAFLHFDLLRMFGKSYANGKDEKSIPYVNRISKEVTPLSTVAEVIELVIDDLEKAENLLQKDPLRTGESTTAFLGTREYHFNYYAVRALKARVFLYKNDKLNALQCAKDVINSEKFPWVLENKVVTSTRDTRDGIFKSECIFILNNTDLKKLTETYLRNTGSNSTGNLLIMDPDVRKEIFESDKFGFDWRSNYLVEPLQDNFVGSTKLWQVSPEYNNLQSLIRVSEMWLIAAECAETKKDAVDCINTLRGHRGFTADNFIVENTTTDEMLQEIIGKEYRKEFIGEGQWFFYCKRRNIVELPNVKVPFSLSYYVLPIPDQELDYGNRN